MFLYFFCAQIFCCLCYFLLLVFSEPFLALFEIHKKFFIVVLSAYLIGKGIIGSQAIGIRLELAYGRVRHIEYREKLGVDLLFVLNATPHHRDCTVPGTTQTSVYVTNKRIELNTFPKPRLNSTTLYTHQHCSAC